MVRDSGRPRRSSAGQSADDLGIVLVADRLGQEASAPIGVLSSWLMLATKSAERSQRIRSLASSTMPRRRRRPPT